MSDHGFHVHGPHDHALEHASHSAPASFSGQLAVITAVLATVGALFSYMGGATHFNAGAYKNDAAIKKTEAANQWAYYQAKKISDAFAQIETGRADALIYDAPVLNHYANTLGKGKVRMAGVVFKAEPYGIALQPDSPYRKAINQAILEIFTDGTHERLTRKWFGTD